MKKDEEPSCSTRARGHGSGSLDWRGIVPPNDGCAGVRLTGSGYCVTTTAAASTTSSIAGATTSPVDIVIVDQIEPVVPRPGAGGARRRGSPRPLLSISRCEYRRLAKASGGFREPAATQALSPVCDRDGQTCHSISRRAAKRIRSATVHGDRHGEFGPTPGPTPPEPSWPAVRAPR
jgi:hypothetical protein